MNTALDLEVQKYCPNAKVIYGLFQVVAKFSREVVDRVRADQANQLRKDPFGRRIIKCSRRLLLRNRQNLTEESAVRLDELLAVNAPLKTVYIQKTNSKNDGTPPTGKRLITVGAQWYHMAEQSGIAPPLKRFAKRQSLCFEGTIARARYRLSTGILEGINNRIKVIKRMAYGYREINCFFLKIKATFPGKAR